MNSDQPDDDVIKALATDRVVDISTLGRKSGQWRRIEIWFHYIDGRVYLTGIPKLRGWVANVLTHPELRFHFKESLQRDLVARVRFVRDPDERRAIMGLERMAWYHANSVSPEAFIADGVLVELIFN